MDARTRARRPDCLRAPLVGATPRIAPWRLRIGLSRDHLPQGWVGSCGAAPSGVYAETPAGEPVSEVPVPKKMALPTSTTPELLPVGRSTLLIKLPSAVLRI